jgi:hypothetical protein
MLTGKPVRFLIGCLLLLFGKSSHAQFLDSLSASAGLGIRAATQYYQPFWMVANQFGTVADLKSDLTSFVKVSNKHVLAASESQNDHGLYDFNDFSLSYGLSVYNNNHFRSTFLEEAYAKLEYRNWSLRAGRFEETTGDLDRQLSSGSLGISGNALPVPKIGIAVTDYKDVPFTNGWLQFKGTFAHGWLGHDRYIKDSYYHEKTFFLRIGKGDLKVYAGIEHFAEWGGKRGSQTYGGSIHDFWDIVLLKESESTPEKDPHYGDHRGVIDGGLYWDTRDYLVHGYIQKPFEGKNDIGFGTMNGLAGFDISWKNKYTGLQKILFEIIDTKNVNNHVPVNKRESYYNNSVYKTGWEYRNYVIGTPLFLNRSRANDYFPEIVPYDWNAPDSAIIQNTNIVSNRIFAIHLGALYSIGGQFDGKTLLTYTANNGNFTNTDLFTPARGQVYCLQQFFYDLPKYNLTLTAGLGLDFGQLSHNDVAGILIGATWNLAALRSQ